MIPSLRADERQAEEGFVARLARWTRERSRYRRALNELRRLDDRDLEDIGIARVDFPELARRHATGAEPLVRSRG